MTTSAGGWNSSRPIMLALRTTDAPVRHTHGNGICMYIYVYIHTYACVCIYRERGGPAVLGSDGGPEDVHLRVVAQIGT